VSLDASKLVGVAIDVVMGMALQDTMYPRILPLGVAGIFQLASREDDVPRLRSKFKGALGTAKCNNIVS